MITEHFNPESISDLDLVAYQRQAIVKVFDLSPPFAEWFAEWLQAEAAFRKGELEQRRILADLAAICRGVGSLGFPMGALRGRISRFSRRILPGNIYHAVWMVKRIKKALPVTCQGF
jgi:hypothetical protein